MFGSFEKQKKIMKLIKISLVAFASLIIVSSCNNQTAENTETAPTEEVGNNSEAPDMHTSETSLDWDGTYVGTLPCADCEGIETTIILNKDKTFERTSVYKGKEGGNFNDKGNFSWDKDGRVITLEVKDENPSYQVREGSIVLLNQEGDVNTGELADLYVLKKQ